MHKIFVRRHDKEGFTLHIQEEENNIKKEKYCMRCETGLM
jgi:hypothetical protein